MLLGYWGEGEVGQWITAIFRIYLTRILVHGPAIPRYILVTLKLVMNTYLYQI